MREVVLDTTERAEIHMLLERPLPRTREHVVPTGGLFLKASTNSNKRGAWISELAVGMLTGFRMHGVGLLEQSSGYRWAIDMMQRACSLRMFAWRMLAVISAGGFN